MRHKKNIENNKSTLKELAIEIVDLEYDSLLEFFEEMREKFIKDAIHDAELGHPKLSKNLYSIAEKLKGIIESDLKQAADICRPFNDKNAK